MTSINAAFPATRMRRTRSADWSRRLVQENTLTANDLIWTIVLSDGDTPRDPVPSMPGVDRVNIDEVVKDAKRAAALGIPAIAVFPHINPKYKNETGDEAANPNGIVPMAVKAIKSTVPDLGVIVDVALDPYTDHGHDGLVHDGEILNDPTLDALCEVGVMLAEAGADVVAPSDMMDGRIGAVRRAIDAAGHSDVMMMSYAAKYASGFYGPYRDAIGSATALTGDKRTYQMDPANTDEALREVALDINEGADMVMVKPGMPYLDICTRVKREFGVPTYAYQVSGEYAMIEAAAQNGWLDGDRAIMESLMCFKRAGCDGVLTYFAPRVAEWLSESS
ncbi:MAG: porphobilinogen synthase [Maricaulaceae bacterium]